MRDSIDEIVVAGRFPRLIKWWTRKRSSSYLPSSLCNLAKRPKKSSEAYVAMARTRSQFSRPSIIPSRWCLSCKCFVSYYGLSLLVSLLTFWRQSRQMHVKCCSLDKRGHLAIHGASSRKVVQPPRHCSMSRTMYVFLVKSLRFALINCILVQSPHLSTLPPRSASTHDEVISDSQCIQKYAKFLIEA